MIILRKTFATTQESVLVPTSTGGFYYNYAGNAFANLSSQTSGMYAVYGIDGGTPRFPFNRTDYFVAVPGAANSLSSACAPGTGMLYKTNISQADGTLSYIPIIDCVLDMQVVLGWDTDQDGKIDTWSNGDGSAVLGLASAATIQSALGNANNNSLSTVPNIRSNLKMIKVYMIVQDGRKDTNFTSLSPLQVGESGEASLTAPAGRSLTAAQLNYRWKQYRIVVRPKNLLSNQ